MKRPLAYPKHLFHAHLLFTFLIFSVLEQLGMTVKGGTSQACAACKYQRRRCSKACALAPYFPADQPKMFQNAHRLFGVSNIMKILRQLRQPHKDEAMRSIIYESNMRARFPVLGCWGIIYQLHVQVQQVTDELNQVRSQLALCKEHAAGFPNPLESGPNLSHFSDPQYMIPDVYGCGNTFYQNPLAEAKGGDMINDGSFNYQIHHQEIDVSRHEYDEIATDIIGEEGLSPKEACESSMDSTFRETTTMTEGVKTMTNNMQRLDIDSKFVVSRLQTTGSTSGENEINHLHLASD